MRDFSFEGQVYTALPDLLNAMGTSWESGKRLLSSGRLSAFFMREDRSIGMRCQAAEKAFQQNTSNGNVLYLRWLCRTPGIPALYWKGKNFGNIITLRTTLIHSPPKELCDVIAHMAKEKYLSEFVINNGGSKEQADRTHYLENLMNRNESRFHKTNAAEILGYILSDSDTFAFDGKRFQKVEQFGAYMRQFASQQSELEAKVNKLYFDDYNLIPAFEGWLINIGKGHELNLWRDIYQKGTEESANGSTNSDNTTVAGCGISQDRITFAETADAFEKTFSDMLKQYTDLIEKPKQFSALMNDLFPGNKMKMKLFLISSLYNMDIAFAIENASLIDEKYVSRFVQRLVVDCQAQKEYAEWAVSVWCYYYGEGVLRKPNRVKVRKIV